jgi:hypothetical protein
MNFQLKFKKNKVDIRTPLTSTLSILCCLKHWSSASSTSLLSGFRNHFLSPSRSVLCTHTISFASVFPKPFWIVEFTWPNSGQTSATPPLPHRSRPHVRNCSSIAIWRTKSSAMVRGIFGICRDVKDLYVLMPRFVLEPVTVVYGIWLEHTEVEDKVRWVLRSELWEPEVGCR